MEKKYIIYGYFQPAENKWYVGRTSKINKSQRSGHNGNNYRKSSAFWSSIKQYGWDTFEYFVLEQTTDEQLSWELEKKWVDLKNSIFPNGYNLESGGTNGKYLSNRTKEKISDYAKKRKWTASTRQKISEAHINNPKISKRVQQYTKKGQFVAEYPSLSEASRQTGIKVTNISSTCRGKAKSSGGYVWKFV